VTLALPNGQLAKASRHRAAQVSIRSVDIHEAPAQASGPSAVQVWGANEPFYGTMSGPWWYHTATSVPRARNLPFSLLRMLILPGCRTDQMKVEG
jgi:hypothetical protein